MKQLLELVDYEQPPPAAVDRGARTLERPHRLLAGAQQHPRPALAARQRAARQPGHQARAHRGGLAAARRADDAQQRRAREPRRHLGDKALAAEEERRVLDVEGGEALERADAITRSPPCLPRGALAHRLDLGDRGRELPLGPTQVAALGGSAVGHRLQPRAPPRRAPIRRRVDARAVASRRCASARSATGTRAPSGA